MAGLFSHLIAGKAIMNMMESDRKRIIKENIQAYYLGTQGPDLFFYYYTRVFSKSTRPLGQTLHKQRVGKFLSELIYHTKHIKNEKDRETALAYILGYLSHYSVDAYTHPYVYFHAGFSTNKTFKLSPKNSLYHRIIENNLDDVLLEYFYKNAVEHHKSIGLDIINPEKYKLIWSYFKIPKHDINTISTLLTTAIELSFDTKIEEVKIRSAIKQMNATLMMIESTSPRNRKLIVFDDDVAFSKVDIDKLKEVQDKMSKKDYFNFEGRTWHAPWDLNIEHNDNFYELVQYGINESYDMFNCIFDYIDYKISFNDLMEIIKNRSLASGTDCIEDITFKYHNVIFDKNKKLKEDNNVY